MNSYYAYVRVSTVKQGEKGSSLQEQRGAIEAYAKRNDLTVAEWFEETETAAKRGRRVFNHMLKLLEKNRAAGVIIHKIDRSARNLKDWADLGEMIDRGVEVHFAHESLDLHSRGGRLSADIQAVVAADYIRNLRDEVRKGFNGRLKQGIYPLPAPLGYKDQGSGLPKTPDPVMGPLVRRAFEIYATGRSNLHALRAQLHALGLRNRRGRAVSLAGLSWVLNNPFYIGLIRIKRTGETYPGIHQPLISKQLFDRVQAILHGRTKNRGLKYDFVFRRFLRCATCGYRLIGSLQKGRVYYRCQTRTCPTTCLREDAVAEQLDRAIAELNLDSLDIDLLKQECAFVTKDIAGSREQDVKALQLSVSQIDDRVLRLTDAYIDRLIDKELFETRKAKLLEERIAIQEKIAEFSQGDSYLDAKLTEFLELIRSLAGKENPANLEEKREFAKSATSNLAVDQKTLVYAWRPPFDAFANWQESLYGAPHRGASRTFHKKSTACGKTQARKPCSVCASYHRLARIIMSVLGDDKE
ncbi:MAG: recombinase family protein [Acidobacteria bacterium]|nr:recombinase family protein [Acidobacteriota bacterium]